MRFPFVRQHDEMDCGAACLSMVSTYYGLKMPLGRYRELVKTDGEGTTLYGLIQGASEVGLKADAYKCDIDELIKNSDNCPFVAHTINEDRFLHFVVVYRICNGYFWIGDPAKGIAKIDVESFCELWTGYLVTFEKTNRFQKDNLLKSALDRYVNEVYEQKWHLFLMIFLSLIIAVISMFGTTLFEYIVDGLYNADNAHVSGRGLISIFFSDMPSLNGMFSAVIVLYVFQAVIQYVRGIISIKVSKMINLPVALKYYTKLTKLPISFFSGRKTGELISRFSDASRICQMIVDTIFTIIIDGILVLFYGFCLLSINPVLFVGAMVLLLFFGVIVLSFKNIIKHAEMAVMEENAKVTSYLKESLQGMETIKSYNVEKRICKKMISLVEKNVETICKAGRVSNLQDTLVDVLVSVGIVVLLWVGMMLCDTGELSVGTLISFYAILGCFLSPMQNIISLQTDIQSTFVAADRLNDIMELSAENNVKQDLVIGGDIKICDATFRYGTHVETIKDCSLNIKDGEKVALIGESGSGKSTLAKLIAGFYELENGSIFIGDFDISKVSKYDLRKNVRYVGQQVSLFSGTIKDNIFLEKNEIDEKMFDELLEIFEFKQRFPFGLDTIVEENGNNMSGGQKQIISFIRAVLSKPKILILDEVTSNIDAVSERIILDYIMRLDLTVVIITHQLSNILECDQIFYLKEKKVYAKGTHDELLMKCDEYNKIWNVYRNR